MAAATMRALWRANTTSFSSRISTVKRLTDIRNSQVFGDKNGYVITTPGEIAVQNCSNDARVFAPYPGVLLQVPLRRQSIRMHDEHILRIPRIGKLLNPACNLSQSAVVRRQPAARSSGHDARGDVSNACEFQKPVVQIKLRNRHRSASRLLESCVHVKHDVMGLEITRLRQNACGLLSCLVRQDPMPNTIHHQHQHRTRNRSDCPTVAANFLARDRLRDSANLDRRGFLASL